MNNYLLNLCKLFIINYSLFIKAPFCHSSKRLLHAPASGNRHRETGALNVVGTYGYAWSSSPTSGSANAGYLEVRASGVLPLGDVNRAYAFPVRCVQHLQLLFQRNTYICSVKAAFGPEWRRVTACTSGAADSAIPGLRSRF